MSTQEQEPARRQRYERVLVQLQCQVFVASWTGVVRYHGPRPVNRPNHVWVPFLGRHCCKAPSLNAKRALPSQVSNHTSMIDYVILTAYSPFAVIMQLHPGWVGFLQTQVLQCLGCLWFNRTEVLFLQCLPLIAASQRK